MATCLIRVLIIYVLLVLAIRTTGKRQIGELEISELVSAFLISEIASAPIGNQEIPLSFAILPILTIISLEIIISFLNTRSAFMKKLFLGSPIILIKRGKLQQKELSKARMSIELFPISRHDKKSEKFNSIPVVEIFQSGHCVHLAFSARHNTTDEVKSPEKS